MFFKRIFQARKGKTREGSIRVRSQGKHIKDTTSCRKHIPPIGDLRVRDVVGCDGNSNVSRIVGDGKSRTDRYPLKLISCARDLVSPDRHSHSFTPSSTTSSPFPFNYIVSMAFNVVSDTRLSLRLTWLILPQICDSCYFRKDTLLRDFLRYDVLFD